MEPAVVAFTRWKNSPRMCISVLCIKDSLDYKQTPLFCTPLKQRGHECGLVFHVEGPRLCDRVPLSADADRIIFYDSIP